MIGNILEQQISIKQYMYVHARNEQLPTGLVITLGDLQYTTIGIDLVAEIALKYQFDCT